MNRAIALASQALGQTSPNPCVGCVIVDQHDNVIGEGYHHKAGQPHAEVLALSQAGERANGSTAYVSLEPCNHYGRTPPCTLALINHGIIRVVVGMVDPDPRVSGTGVIFLKDHCINVDIGIEAEKCESLNRPFIYRVLNKRPLSVAWVCLTQSENVSDCLNSQLRRIDIVASQLTTVAPEIDSIVFQIDDFIELPHDALKMLPSHVSIFILGMKGKRDVCDKAIERVYLEDDSTPRKWYLFLTLDDDLTSTRDNVRLVAAGTSAYIAGNYSSLLSREMLQKIASLGSNAILMMVSSLEELRELKSNDALQRVIFTSMETSFEESSNTLYNTASKVVSTLMDHDGAKHEDPVLEVTDTRDIIRNKKIPVLSFNFWKR